MARQKKRAKSRVNIPIILAAILLCLTLISIRLAGGIVARYTTTTDSGDSARVIKFGDISLTLTGGNEQYIIPGMPLEWNALVSFTGSESATYVFVEVTPTGSCTVSADGMNYTFPPAVTDGWTVNGDIWTHLGVYNGTHVYYCSLAPNATMGNAPLFNSNTVTVDPNNVTADNLNGMSTISATFGASVVQSNGFTGPEAAWASLEDNHKRVS